MRRYFNLPGLCAVAFLLASFGMTGTKAYVSQDGRFSVKFKAEPVLSSETVETEVGKVKMYFFLHEESTAKACMVAYSDYPAEAVSQDKAMQVLEGARDGVVTNFEAFITSQKQGKFQGYPCIDFTASGPTFHTSYKLILAKNRLYQVGILQSGKVVAPKDTKSFVGSFKISG